MVDSSDSETIHSVKNKSRNKERTLHIKKVTSIDILDQATQKKERKLKSIFGRKARKSKITLKQLA